MISLQDVKSDTAMFPTTKVIYYSASVLISTNPEFGIIYIHIIII